MLPERTDRERPWTAASHTATDGAPHRLALVETLGASRSRPENDASGQQLGTRLRAERERRRVTLAEISDRTKIAIGLLQELERNDVSRWPTGIYRRGFIRGYAESIGLDADRVARDFFEAFPESDGAECRPDAGGTAVTAGRPHGETLRLMLADPGSADLRVRALAELRDRALAFAFDAVALVLFAAVLSFLEHAFWAPFALATMAYYGTSVLAAGSTPGTLLMSSRAWRQWAGGDGVRRRHAGEPLG